MSRGTTKARWEARLLGEVHTRRGRLPGSRVTSRARTEDRPPRVVTGRHVPRLRLVDKGVERPELALPSCLGLDGEVAIAATACR